MRFHHYLLANPLTLWAAWLWGVVKLKFRNQGKRLCVGYLAVAKRSSFGRDVTLYDHVHLDGVAIGDMSYVSRGTRIANTTIGKYSCIGPESLIGLGRHPASSFVSSHPAFFSTRKQPPVSFVEQQKFEEFQPITIGNDVWIGARAVVLDGASIGDGAIIAAGAVVSGTIPPYAIARGIPAKVAKFRFDPATIEGLLRSRWWDLPQELLRANARAFESPEAFERWQREADPTQANAIE